MTTSFRLLKQFEEGRPARLLERRMRVRPKDGVHFEGEGLANRFGQALCEEQATSIKEILEAFEFFQAVRKFVLRPHMADICSGHGLVGILFALFERKVESVTLIDQAQPGSYARILAAADRIGPWAREKVHFRISPLRDAETVVQGGDLVPGTGLLGVHACGSLTDQILEWAIRLEGPLAVLPCCRQHRQHAAPEVLKRELGGDLAIDVHRTYALDHAGYQVRWKKIPEVITPMNRVLIGVPRAPASAPTEGVQAGTPVDAR
ncbi:MAG: hypothetical protein H6830_12665 [Planctomycetes bacterium]|nr:hypothetical protein [Planctomycetota bacterium]